MSQNPSQDGNIPKMSNQIKKYLETTSIDLTLRDEVVSEKPIKREVKNEISNKKLNGREMEVIMFRPKKSSCLSRSKPKCRPK